MTTVVENNNTLIDGKYPVSVINRICTADIIRRSAARTPNKVAIIEGDREITYREFDHLVSQFANYLLSRGLQKGDKVATLCLNTADFVIVMFGVARAGLVWVPMNPLSAGEDLQYVITHSEAKLLIADDELLPRVRHEIESIFSGDILLISVKNLDIKGDNIKLFADEIKSQSTVEPLVDICERDVAQIMYTSGTTAKAKGVMQSHLSVYIASLGNIIEQGLTKDDVSSCLMPLFHCAQHTLSSAFWHLGATAIIVRHFQAESFMDLVQKHKITWTFALPMMYRALLESDKRYDYDISTLRYCLYAMAPMDQGTLERLIKEICPNFALISGQTEMYPGTVWFKPEEQLRRFGAYWGQPSLINDMAIMDDSGNLLPRGEVGELVQRGPNVMEGYFKNPEATAESRQFGWHHTGDLAMFDEDGQLLFIDRKKDMIKTGGENVPSVKVERVLLSHHAVANATAVGLPHEHWIEAVTAFIIPKEGQEVSQKDIIDLCAAHLGLHEIPKAVIFLDKFPMTTTGKIQKHVLRKEYAHYYESHGDLHAHKH